MLKFTFGRNVSIAVDIWAFTVPRDMSVFAGMKKEKTEATSDPEIIYKMLVH